VRLAAAAEKLEPVLDQMAFVGGSVTGLPLTGPAAAAVRPTLDVDAMIAIDSYVEFTLLANRVRDPGVCQPHTEATATCRWAIGGLILDLRPTDSSIPGFSSRWYSPAGEGAENQDWWSRNPRDHSGLFSAAKREAFHTRGKNDFRSSRDLGDIVTVTDGRPELMDEVHLSPADLRNYLGNRFRDRLSNRDFCKRCPANCCQTLPARNASAWWSKG
jgi:hypothetical protein